MPGREHSSRQSSSSFYISVLFTECCPSLILLCTGTLSLAFVGPPNVKVQLSPYNRVRLMRIPVVQVCVWVCWCVRL
jgi:hypothetical protein